MRILADFSSFMHRHTRSHCKVVQLRSVRLLPSGVSLSSSPLFSLKEEVSWCIQSSQAKTKSKTMYNPSLINFPQKDEKKL